MFCAETQRPNLYTFFKKKAFKNKPKKKVKQ